MTDETNGALNGELRPAAPLDTENATPEAASSPPEDEFEGATPPGYDWPTHGGYLGCLMGVMAGVLLGGFLGANIFAAYYNVLDLPLAVYILLNVVLFLALLIGLGRLGWYLGRRYYRYYPQPAGPTWGEADEAEGAESAENQDTPNSALGETHEAEANETPGAVAQDMLDAQDESQATEQRQA